MTLDEKKAQLALYRIQLVKIERLHQMLFKNPDRRDTYKSAIHRAERLRNSIEDAVERVDGGILSEILFQKYFHPVHPTAFEFLVQAFRRLSILC